MSPAGMTPSGLQISVRTDEELNLVLFFVVAADTEPGDDDKPFLVADRQHLKADQALFTRLLRASEEHIGRLLSLPPGTVWNVKRVGGVLTS